jgi:methyl-accepting chemotaxis protein
MADTPLADLTITRLTAVEAGQTAMRQALGLMLDTLKQQTNLLREIAAAVQDEPGPSPVLESLDELTEAVTQIGVGIESLSAKLEALPDAISAAMDGNAAPPGERSVSEAS